MPEKTLKEPAFAKASVDEKVERARQHLGNKGFHPHLDAVCLSITEVGVIKEALTALEESNECLWVFIRRIADRFDEYDLWRDNKDLLEAYEELRKEAPDDGK